MKHRVLWTRKNAIALGIFLVCWLLCLWLMKPNVNLLTPEGLKQGIKNFGFFAPLVYIIVLAISVVISPIPSAPLAVVAGAMWGSLPAGIYSVIGGFLGSLIAYYLGRTLGRSTIKALTGKIIYFSKARGELYLSWIIFITRLLPVFSFDLMSYGAGIAGLSFSKYAIATLLGMIPSTFLLTYMGDAWKVEMPLGVIFSAIFLIILVGLPWVIRRYNWLGLRDIIRIE